MGVERAERKDRDAVGGGALTALTPTSPAWREISACELYMIYFSSEERQGGGAYIGASLKLYPSHDSSEKKTGNNSEKNRSLPVASTEDLEMEWRRVKL
ncbi:hypothetical protein AVEN_211239-1 [Araneus ventricosus]|uniref:Uncharacterized protein n=1 Tax=Araneus ventricosus TaxID=182803 RepID=A0A4Y2Q2M0_ARAVE|nr:hypothetical protein AVEN_211239-1 [Araneus ventricosus]